MGGSGLKPRHTFWEWDLEKVIIFLQILRFLLCFWKSMRDCEWVQCHALQREGTHQSIRFLTNHSFIHSLKIVFWSQDFSMCLNHPSAGSHALGRSRNPARRLQGPALLYYAHLFSLSFKSPCNSVRSIWKLFMCNASMMANAVILAFIELEIKFRRLQSQWQ